MRTVSEFRARRLTDDSPWAEACALIAVEITADGFLYNMVRSIVGTLVKVAQGQGTAEDVNRVLKSCDRSQAGPTAPPQGLSLVRVDYDGADVVTPDSAAGGVADSATNRATDRATGKEGSE